MNSLDFVPYSLCMELLRGWFKLIIHNKTDYKVFMLKYRVKIFLTFFLQRSFKLIKAMRLQECKAIKSNVSAKSHMTQWHFPIFNMSRTWVRIPFPHLLQVGKKKNHIPFGKTIFRKLIDVICLFGC